MKVLIATYSHPEFYPPILNAVELLSERADRITLLARNVLPSRWTYPGCVRLVLSGKLTDIRAVERKPTWWKIGSFLRYAFGLWRLLRAEKPHVVILQDAIPLFAFFLVRKLIGYRPRVWYHNHDVIEKGSVRKYSVSWFAQVYEPRMFKEVDVFSLPATERQSYFPMSELKGKFYFLPNLPRKAFYNPFYEPKKGPGATLQLLYQGEIGRGHGFEEIIPALQRQVSGRDVCLNLIGPVPDDYRRELEALAAGHGVAGRLKFHGKLPYRELPAFTRQFDVGLAIHKPLNSQYATGGTASNKIYEYAALGLPVLLYDDEHYRQHLGGYPWTFFTDLREASLLDQLEKIVADYAHTSRSARKDFTGHLNFENYFNRVLTDLPGNTATRRRPVPSGEAPGGRAGNPVTQPTVL